MCGADIGELTILNRTPARAQVIAEEAQKHGARAQSGSTNRHDLGPALERAELVINTTSVGMTPHSDATPLAQSLLRPDLAVYDIVYNPLETRLLREARAAGARGVDGLGMLIYTNVYAAKVCADRDISAKIMREEAMRAFGEK